ncbi:uncharacterized protein LOC123561440 isoform X2 [Mercenaria mercenaria]|uniref:uncharacterized protein LOC123561440 isoform X2 n=1 Tax=Mercenaria mercenaria TaxID=6596 RepID=UPI00234F4ABA|nr:uncharacterized protein LOC123561440 isoform X2 [Mercenaria mercenaria]
MFTVQTVHSNDEEGHPINVQFANETPSVQEMTSHDLGNHGDLGQDEGHTLEHIEGQCQQSLGQTDVTSVQGSYVSLLADIATIEQNDEYSGQQIAQDISDTVDYATSTFTGQEHIQELASLQNENLVSYQSVENHNIGYSLTNPVESGPGMPQYVIIQPFLGDTGVNGSSTLIHLPNTAESLDSNRELEDAVANITEKAMADTDETLDGKVIPDQSYLVSTNSRGEVREIQVVEGEQSWTANETEVSTNKRKGRLKGLDKGVKGKRKKSVITEKKESSSHVKKFSLDDLNSAGKSKKEVFEEYLVKSKVRNDMQTGTKVDTFASDIEKSSFNVECGRSDTNLQGINTLTENSTEILNAEMDKTSDLVEILIFSDTQSASDIDKVNEICQSDSRDKSLESQMMGNLQRSVKENESVSAVEDKLGSEKDTAKFSVDAEEINKDSVKEKKCLRVAKHQTSISKSRILRSRQALDKNVTTQVKFTGKESEDLETNLSKEKDVVRLKNKGTTLKRKKHMPNLKQSHKLPKMDDLCEEKEQIEDEPTDDNIDCRVLEDFCRFFRSEEKCILHLEPITLKLVNPNQLLMIEMDVQSDFNVSSLEMGVTADGLTKYYVKFSVPEKFALDNVEDISNPADEKQKVERICNKTQKQALKCLKSSRRKQNKKTIKEKNLVSDKDTGKALRSKEKNSQEIDEKCCNDSENLDSEIKADAVNNHDNNESKDTQQVEDDHREEIETETHDDADELETNEDTDISKNQTSNEGSNATKSKRKKDGKLSGKKKSKVDKSSSKDTKEDSSQKNYTVVVSEEGIRMYMCPVCGYMSKYVQNAKKHIYEHTATRDWICEMCGMSFKSNNNLQKHKIVHSDTRPFPCPLCPQTFKSNGVMKQHLQRHIGLKAYVCEYCSKEFVTRGDLNKHTRSHTGATPYNCKQCQKTFSDISALYRHIAEKHVTEKPFMCSVCNQTFARKPSALIHVKKHHSNVTGNTDRENLETWVTDSKSINENLPGDNNQVHTGFNTNTLSTVELSSVVDSVTIL